MMQFRNNEKLTLCVIISMTWKWFCRAISNVWSAQRKMYETSNLAQLWTLSAVPWRTLGSSLCWRAHVKGRINT